MKLHGEIGRVGVAQLEAGKRGREMGGPVSLLFFSCMT